MLLPLWLPRQLLVSEQACRLLIRSAFLKRQRAPTHSVAHTLSQAPTHSVCMGETIFSLTHTHNQGEHQELLLSLPRAGRERDLDAGSPDVAPQLPSPCLTSPCPLSSFLAGVATRLSRRRVSCRELGKVDCDGWLLKKKDHVGFMSQKWKRCWFVLKGHVLYWYNQPSDEKAVGLINVSTYDLESTREQKKKYVFQLLAGQRVPCRSEGPWQVRAFPLIVPSVLLLPDCYSETEAEDPDDDAPRPGSDLVSLIGEEGGSYSPAGESPDSPGKELESLIQCLKQGGVSLIGTRQLLTHEQYRRSFIKRNKNPQINERVHLVRALQSTLKAKVAELQILDQLLNDSELTSEKFRHWKKEHQELYQEIPQWWAPRPSQAEGLEAELGAESSPQEAAGVTP
uniref:PH domain-containing protein n=1 Tax=Chrysemys picta bellii TaxID=8478 RepID=A0A8C3IM22_CHRPI